MAGTVRNRGQILLSSLVLFCVSLFLTAYSAKNRWLAGVGSAAVAEIMRPFQAVLHGSSQRLTDFWDHYLALVRVGRENQQLRDRLQALEVENSRLLEWEGEIKRLRNLLGIAEENRIQGVAADVIGHDPSNWVKAVTVDKGSVSGVRPGMAAIQGNAVVGQVISVSRASSRILLITDPNSGVDSIIQANRTRGVAQGVGREFCELQYVSREEEVAVGDRIITSGMDGVYPKGLVIGVVAEIDRHGNGLFQSIRVKPMADFARLETVLIITSSPALEEPASERK